jgi:ATP-dependent Clp protease ATP-binding subunit ClpC
VRQRPYSVVLFDEIEKAHPDVMNILLQIMEEGRLTDSFGRKIDFRNTIVIMTSNLGADLIRKSTEVGFAAKSNHIDYAQIKDKIQTAANKQFKPEFLNRLNDMVIFRPLERESLMHVIEIEVKKLQKRLSDRDIVLDLDDAAKGFLVDKGFQPEMGARPLRRTIETYLEDPLAEKMLTYPTEDHHYFVRREGEQLVFKHQNELESTHVEEAVTSTKS